MRTGATLIALVVLLVIAWSGSQLLLMVFAGLLFGIFLDTVATWIAGRTGLSHGWSLTLVLLILSGLSVLFAWAAYPALAEQSTALTDQLSESVQKIKRVMEKSPISKLAPSETSGPQGLGRSVVSRLGAMVTATMDGIVAAVVIVFVGIYLAAEPSQYRRGLIRLIPPGKRDRAREVMSELGQVLRRWVMARIILMVVNGSLTTIGLWIIGIPLAPILGLIAGLLNFVPNIGPIVAAVPAILIAFTRSLTDAAYTAALYLVLQMADGYVFTPLAQKRAVSLAPALIISFQVLMGLLAGTLGLLLATPLAAALAVTIRRLYVEDALGDYRDAGPA
jgi:predicted PurR-regulated permease PerM